MILWVYDYFLCISPILCPLCEHQISPQGTEAALKKDPAENSASTIASCLRDRLPESHPGQKSRKSRSHRQQALPNSGAHSNLDYHHFECHQTQLIPSTPNCWRLGQHLRAYNTMLALSCEPFQSISLGHPVGQWTIKLFGLTQDICSHQRPKLSSSWAKNAQPTHLQRIHCYRAALQAWTDSGGFWMLFRRKLFSYCHTLQLIRWCFFPMKHLQKQQWQKISQPSHFKILHSCCY